MDLQVNGYAGVDFNCPDITPEAMHAACQQLRADGVSGILATVITDRLDTMAARLAHLVEIRESDPLVRDSVRGFHIEGPFINPAPGYVGAHPPDCVIPADVGAMHSLLDAAGGLTRMVTLAPEQDANLAVTRFLAGQSIVVAAGHTNASRDQLQASIDAGLSLFTHLGNGCPETMARHDNIIQRVLSLSDRLWITVIADGVHIPFFVLTNYLARTGFDRVAVVTDAISAAGLGPGRYTIGDQQIDIGPDLISWADDHSHLIGSTMTMPRVVENLVQHLRLTTEQIQTICVENPERILDR